MEPAAVSSRSDRLLMASWAFSQTAFLLFGSLAHRLKLDVQP
jgi:hypothetical protein